MLPDAPQFKHDVFISYARRDAEIGAVRLEVALKQRQPSLRLWRDEYGINPTQYFTTEIEAAIEQSRCIIVCVTEDVKREDSFVPLEIAYARKLKKPIFVARFADVDPPLLLMNHTWIDFHKNWDTAFDQVVPWLNRTLSDVSTTAAAVDSESDPYHSYLELLLTDIVENLRISVLSPEPIPLRMKNSPADVRAPRKFVIYPINDQPYRASHSDLPSVTYDSLKEAFESASCSGRVLLLGEPGAGKTTSLLAFARSAVVARLNDANQPLPIFARIATWNADQNIKIADWLSSENEGITNDQLGELESSNKLLLLLDGLDELGERRIDPQSREPYDPRERFLGVLPANVKLILSSRAEEYRRIGEKARANCAVSLEPLNDGQIQAFLEDVPELWNIVASEDRAFKDALRNPLLLALFRKGYERTPEAVRALRKLSAGELNERIFDVVIEERWAYEQARSQPLRYTATELKQRLGEIAIAMLDTYNSTFDSALLGSDAEEILALAIRLNLVQSINETTFRFLHLRLRDALVFPILMASMSNRAFGVRAKATILLGRIGDQRSLKLLSDALKDLAPEVRSSAVSALRSIRNSEIAESLISVLNDPEGQVRELAADALVEIGEPAISPLIAGFHHPDWNVRSYAADIVKEICEGEPTGWIADAIITLFDHQDAYVRLCAVRALGKPEESQPRLALTRLLDDPSASVRLRAAHALGLIG